MLNDDQLYFHNVSQGRIAVMTALDWILKNSKDTKKMQETMLLLQSCIENTNPVQDSFQKVIDTNIFVGMEVHLKLFTTLPWKEAIQQLYKLPEKKWGENCFVLLEFFRKLDDIQLKSVCKNDCVHEWHHLHKLIRTEDLLGLVGFYTTIGLHFTHHIHHNSEHYQGRAGQSELLIYRITRSQKLAGSSYHLRFRIPNFGEVIDSLNKRQIPVTVGPAENGTGLQARLKDPDGRTVTLYDSI